ncbi:hypothetical protein GP486_007033 [Trichoglossum hirsutum]|uniref:Uncharacterized protein n=1 Tax=Trichoglossum hirsutum TaxID=265104 RepID=A0A9P8ICI2_9PEZI|nr:hypothetical protein GP486_007033 [Trichoglossum hirsutum]
MDPETPDPAKEEEQVEHDPNAQVAQPALAKGKKKKLKVPELILSLDHSVRSPHRASVSHSYNPTGLVRNPLDGIPRETLLASVDDFAREQNMEDILPLLRKGALVAQDPAGFETIDELDDGDRRVLRDEITHKWRQPWALYFTVVTCSVGAAVQCGYPPAQCGFSDHNGTLADAAYAGAGTRRAPTART